MPGSILLTLLLLLGLGLAVVFLQVRNKRKGFMTPGQDTFVSLAGMVAFLGLTFVAVKMLLPSGAIARLF